MSFKDELEQVIDKGGIVEVTLKSTGWKIFEKIVEQKKKELKDIYKITTIKELEARKLAIKKIDEALNDFKDIVNQGYQSAKDLDKLRTHPH